MNETGKDGAPCRERQRIETKDVIYCGVRCLAFPDEPAKTAGACAGGAGQAVPFTWFWTVFANWFEFTIFPVVFSSTPAHASLISLFFIVLPVLPNVVLKQVSTNTPAAVLPLI
jgi:hypothetical protein